MLVGIALIIAIAVIIIIVISLIARAQKADANVIVKRSPT